MKGFFLFVEKTSSPGSANRPGSGLLIRWVGVVTQLIADEPHPADGTRLIAKLTGTDAARRSEPQRKEHIIDAAKGWKMARPIKLTKEKFDDSGDGYSYVGWYYTLDLGSVVYRVRRYQDTPDEASFMTYHRPPSATQLSFNRIPLDDREFMRAARHLVQTLGLRKLRVLTDKGYLTFRPS